MGLLLAALLASPGQASPILEERFDDPGALSRWKAVDGARVGPDPASRASLDGGALLLEADAGTRRWLSLERSTRLAGARWVRVSARVRTADVDPSRARYANCNLYAHFPRGPVLPLRGFAGTNPWTVAARRLPVPAGAEEMTVACFLSMPGRAWFDDVRVEAVEPPKWEEARAGRTVYRWLRGDGVPEKARAYNLESWRLVSGFLGAEGPAEILFVKYPDVAVKEEYSGTGGNAHVQGDEIHTIWPTDRHEIVHILARAWGDPPALLGEGLAVHLSGEWQGRPVLEAARAILESGKWIPLDDLLDTLAFRQKDDLVTYGIAGAFSQWIAEAHGKEKLRALFGRLRAAAPVEENRRLFVEILGVDLREADARLRARLQGK
jgi:hypothetical protein